MSVPQTLQTPWEIKMAVTENDLVVGPIVPAVGVTTISLDFYFVNNADIEVYKSGSETPLILTTDYTLAGAGSLAADGVVTLVVAADGVDSYSVYLVVPLERSTDMQSRGAFLSNPFNSEIDRLWQAMQGVRAKVDRALQISKTSEIPEVVSVVPKTYLYFDASGNLTTIAGAVLSVPVSTFMATVLDDVDAAAARATLGAAGLTAAQTFTAANIFSALATFSSRLDIKSGFPAIRLENTDAPIDVAKCQISLENDGTLRIDPTDASGVLLAGISLGRDAGGITDVTFNINGAAAAVIEASGTTMTSDQAVVTKEKGDAAYLSRSILEVDLASSVFTVSNNTSLVILDTEAGAATGVCRGIGGGVQGQVITIIPAHSSRDVTFLSGYGGNPPPFEQLLLSGGFSFAGIGDSLTLAKNQWGTWTEVSRSTFS